MHLHVFQLLPVLLLLAIQTQGAHAKDSIENKRNNQRLRNARLRGEGSTSMDVASQDEDYTKYEKNANNVIFFLYTKKTKDSPEMLFYNATTKPFFKNYDPKRKTVVLLHGSSESPVADYAQIFIEENVHAFLHNGDYNIIAVNWVKLAYYSRLRDTTINSIFVGQHTGSLIKCIKEAQKEKPEPFHLVAHHTGTTAAVLITQTVRIERITGLSPPDLGRETFPRFKYLHKYNADLVEVLHTYGMEANLAHRDFYANAGDNTQSGCWVENDNSCNIRRAFEMYAIDVYYNGSFFTATNCDNFDDYQNKKCENSVKISLYNNYQPHDVPVGKYYFKSKANFVDIIRGFL